MFLRLLVLSAAAVAPFYAIAQDAAPKPPLKITPGKVIIPFDRMQRPWGELISLDEKTRTGTFRRESTDEVVKFTVLPYAELLHHAANGDLQDFRIGERAIFRLHENEAGQWVWLTYIQDEMNMMNGHKEYFYVDVVDPEKGTFTSTQANADRSFTREKGIVVETDKETRTGREESRRRSRILKSESVSGPRHTEQERGSAALPGKCSSMTRAWRSSRPSSERCMPSGCKRRVRPATWTK